MFEAFRLSTIDVAQASIRVRHGGSGPPLLLLHGNPQTHVMWHLIAPRLAEDFTVIATDLRGYGDSSKLESTPDHEPYSKSLASSVSLSAVTTAAGASATAWPSTTLGS
jgi:haloacetate dehalogenase